MLPGWAYFRDEMPFCKKNGAKEVGGRIFEVGVFSRDYGTFKKGSPWDVLGSPMDKWTDWTLSDIHLRRESMGRPWESHGRVDGRDTVWYTFKKGSPWDVLGSPMDEWTDGTLYDAHFQERESVGCPWESHGRVDGRETVWYALSKKGVHGTSLVVLLNEGTDGTIQEERECCWQTWTWVKSNGSTRKLRYNCSGVLCVARQRLVTKFAAVAWRHSVMLAGCLYKVYGDMVFVVLLKSPWIKHEMKVSQTNAMVSEQIGINK